MRHSILASLLLAATALACKGQSPPRQDSLEAIRPGSPRPAEAPKEELRLPRVPGSLRFAVIGDSGRGDQPQMEVAAQLEAFRSVVDYDFVLMLGDNIYGTSTPEDYLQKFEIPYAPLLAAGVKFFAVIGNHDDAKQHLYPLFNTGGHRYYTFKPPSRNPAGGIAASVRFFMLDTEFLDATQVRWLRRELAASTSEWKIVVCHRPLFTSGRYALPAQRFRKLLQPILVRHGVSAVFSGHEHFYERTRPQQGITYFISGGAGSLRRGDLRSTMLTAEGFDDDYSFMIVEIAGDEMHYQAITRTGATVDSGVLQRRR